LHATLVASYAPIDRGASERERRALFFAAAEASNFSGE
jgi:hypothetical protein